MSASPAAAPVRERRVERLRALLPEIRALVRARAGVLTAGMILVIVSRAAGLAPPAATKVLIDDVLGKRRLDLLPVVVLAVTAATLVQGASSFALAQIFTRSTSRLVAELRGRLHAHVLRLPLRYHDVHKSGELGSRIMNDVAGLPHLVGAGLLGFFGSVVTALLALGVMARFSPRMAAAALACALLAGAIAARTTRRAKDISHERGDIIADISGRLTEALGGVRVLKAYRAEGREDAIFSAHLDRLVDNTLKNLRVSSASTLATTVAWGLVNAVVMYAGVTQIVAGRLTLGAFFTVTVVLNYLAAPVLSIVGVGTMVMEALAGLERVQTILAERSEHDDARRAVDVGPIRGEVVFDRVGFAYEPGKPVLHDVSFRAAPGTITALAGPSGSGKSTITGLIASFYVPTAGAVTVDGADVSTVRLEGYRAQVGVVLQETFLFDGSILDNIAFARPEASRAEVLSAARSARVDEFAERLPEGWDTLVGERGVRLSGGQRQRISIARALLADPRILILDEATSSLDATSEALIQEALARLLVGRTTFIIAHRLSTIRAADQILVVDRGRVVERGAHAALLAQGGTYADLVKKQQEAAADRVEGSAGERRAARVAVVADDLLPPI